MVANPVSIAQTLIDARKAAGLSQATLAERMSTTQPAISKVESGRAVPTLGFLERTAPSPTVEEVLRHTRREHAELHRPGFADVLLQGEDRDIARPPLCHVREDCRRRIRTAIVNE